MVSATKTLSVNDLQSYSSTDLRAVYPQIIDRPPPKRASHNFLLGNLCWALQVKQSRQQPNTLRDKMISRTTKSHDNKYSYQPGTRLVREWHGQTYEVTITAKGYRFQERYYRSLTGIAREITGINWSGPRFFGLTRSCQ